MFFKIFKLKYLKCLTASSFPSFSQTSESGELILTGDKHGSHLGMFKDRRECCCCFDSEADL